MTSKLEAALANDLFLMASKFDAPWPLYEREYRPLWCCAHSKRKHWAPPVHPVAFCALCEVVNIGGQRPGAPGTFHAYDKPRAFRVDFAYPAFKVAIECEGVNWGVQGGRHQTGAGFSKDLSKYGILELAGWRVIRVGAAQIKDGTALSLIEQALGVTA